jgi:hypothetical protein
MPIDPAEAVKLSIQADETGFALKAALNVAVPGVHFPSASDDEALGRHLRADAAEDLAALRRVSDAAIGDELFRRREARTPTGAT